MVVEKLREQRARVILLDRHKGTGGRVSLFGILQTGRKVSQNPSDPRCPYRSQQGEGAARLGSATDRAAQPQPEAVRVNPPVTSTTGETTQQIAVVSVSQSLTGSESSFSLRRLESSVAGHCFFHYHLPGGRNNDRRLWPLFSYRVQRLRRCAASGHHIVN